MITKEKSRWFRKRAWAEINFDHLIYNVTQIRESLSPTTKLMAVVKADAYGHGDYFVAPFLEKQGVDWFGVSDLEEATSLRRNGISIPILIFAPISIEYVSILAEQDLTVTVTSLEYAARLEQAAEQAGVTVKVHIKLDTGMHRIGFLVDHDHLLPSVEELHTIVTTFSHIQITGTYTHFAAAEDPDDIKMDYTKEQFYCFTKALQALQAKGIDTGICHCCNSGGTLGDEEYHLDMVRTGILLYGNYAGTLGKEKVDLKPVMSLHSRIHDIRTIEAGDKVGYGITYTAPDKVVVGTLGLGYADGYHRMLSNKAQMIVKGQRVPCIGNVCMDQLMIDITQVENVEYGEKVTVVGSEGDAVVTWDEIGKLAGSINYEMICAVGRRVPRIYRQGGEDIAVLTYQNCNSHTP